MSAMSSGIGMSPDKPCREASGWHLRLGYIGDVLQEMIIKPWMQVGSIVCFANLRLMDCVSSGMAQLRRWARDFVKLENSRLLE